MRVPSHEDLVKAGWFVDETDPALLVTVTEVNAGHVSTVRLTKLQHDYLAEQRRQRQARGLFTVCEVAQLFENSSFVPDGTDFLSKRLLPAIRSGALRAVSEADGFSITGDRVSPISDCLRPNDVNEWLEREGVQFRWTLQDNATESQAAPVLAQSSGCSPAWMVRKPLRYGGYTAPLYQFIAAAQRDGGPRPSARDVLEAWRIKKPAEVAQVLSDGFDYYDAKGNTKPASLDSIRKAIDRLTSAR